MNRYSCSILLFLSSIVFAQPNKFVWKAELQDDVKKIQPIQNGKYIFLWADEYAWLYENASGKKVWSVKINDYNEKAVHQLVNDSLYLVSNEDTLMCYDIVNGTLLWKKSYQGIEQDRFSGIKLADTICVLSFKNVDLGISLLNGKELWRLPVEYEQSLVEKGTVNSIILDKSGKYFAFLDNDECALISLMNGKKMLSLPKSEPNGDLIKQKRAWYYVSSDQKFAAIMFEKNFVVIDVDANKIVAQRPVDISDQYNVLMPTAAGCAVVGEEKFVHVNFSTGKIVEAQIDIDNLRNLVAVQTDSGAVMIVSQENKLIGLNLDHGKLLWQTAPKFPVVNGFIHHFVASDRNNVVVTYLDPSDDLKLYLMSIDALTGKINYRTLIAHADESLPKRVLPLPAISSVTTPTSLSFGFDNIGFDYEVSVSNGYARLNPPDYVVQAGGEVGQARLNGEVGQAKFLIRTSSEMIEPNSDRKGGEGFVLVHLESGEVTSKNYMKIADGISFKGGLPAIATPMTIGNVLLIPGNKNLVAMNATTGALKWMHVEQDLSGSYVFDMAMVDSILYVRTGGFKQEFSYDVKKEKLSDKKLWEEDDYTLLAIDTSSGKIYWKKKFEADPGRIFHDYSIANYARDGKQLFFCDEKFLYSLSLSPAKRDSINWKFEFSDSGIGKMNYDDLFQQSTRWIGEQHFLADSSGFKNDAFFTLMSSTAVNETFNRSVSKILHVNYSNAKDKLVVFGEDGIASINTATGKREWYYEWEYSAKAIHYRPMILKDNIFYFIDGKAVLLNFNTGKLVWQTKLDKANALFIMPDRSSIIAIEKDEVTGFVIP